MAWKLVTSDADVRLSERDQAGHLYDQHDRVIEHDAMEVDEESFLVPERRGGL